MFLKNKGSIVYQANFALLKPSIKLLFSLAFSNKSSCPCGILANFHAPIFFTSIEVLLDSKSSMYEIPSLPTALWCPGIRCANSAVTINLDFAFVSMRGNLSIAVVNHGNSV